MDIIVDTEKAKPALSTSGSALEKRLKAMGNRVVLKTCGVLIPAVVLLLALFEWTAG